MLLTSGKGDRKIEWREVGGRKSVRTTKAVVEGFVEECLDAEFSGKLQAHFVVTAAGMAPRHSMIAIESVEAGEAMIADRLAQFAKIA